MSSHLFGEKRENKFYFRHMIFSALFLVLLIGAYYALFISHKFPLSISWKDFIILSLAIFRATRLLVYDKVLDFIKDFFTQRKDSFSQTVGELLYCPWCTGIWVSLFLTFLYFWSDTSWYFLFLLAVAGIASIIQVGVNLIIRVTEKIKSEIKK